MDLKRLKGIRVGVSLLFFIVFGFLFLDVGNIVPPGLTNLLVSLQIIPALTKSIVSVGVWSGGAVVVLLLTLAFGRVYCSSICPLGTLQDVVIRFAQKRNRKRRFRYTPPRYVLHYALLGLALALFLAGNLVLLNLLEPFSNFGRMIQGIVRPVVVGANNGIAEVTGWFGFYGLYRIPFRPIDPVIVAMPVLFLGLIAYLSYKHGRLFCNLLCPAGALLGLLSRVSFFRIVVDKGTCMECGLCERVCKAGCIDSDTMKIEFSACVSCFNCIKACPTIGLKYEGLFGKRSGSIVPGPDEGRRKIILGSLGPIALLAGTSIDSTSQGPARKREEHPVTPPGSKSILHFSSHCTACHLCVSQCPTQVLSPSFLDYGIGGIFQPRMDYHASYCNYDCNVCGTVCPTGAIIAVPLADKKLIQMGKAQFVKDDCIVITKKTDCGACSEHCPTKAVYMIPHEKLFLPEVNNDICVGCGACEHSCPTKPRKAIYVESNPIHLKAQKPQIKKLEQPAEKATDFPF